MKTSLLILSLIYCCTFISQVEVKPPQDSIVISGHTIYKFHTHGGSLANLSTVKFTVKNLSNEKVRINPLELVEVHTNREGEEQFKKLTINTVNSLNIDSINPEFILPAGEALDLEFNFETISVGIFYYKSYRAIRLKVEINGNVLTCDSKLDVTRVEPYNPNDD